MFWSFIVANWQELIAAVALQYASWRYWRWYYVGKKPKYVMENLND